MVGTKIFIAILHIFIVARSSDNSSNNNLPCFYCEMATGGAAGALRRFELDGGL